MTNSRVSCVPLISIIDVGNTGVFEIGDSQRIAPTSNIIAVQREKAIFWENEFDFHDYSMFQEQIPQPFVYENIEMTTVHECPCIHVENIEISFVAASSTVQIGSSQTITAESRVKHIRHLLREKSNDLTRR